ncbi:MAG: hypothetical protein ABI355_03555, partial [Solirubrobacteraceae bacterium]
MRRTTVSERERLHATFAQLCAIPSPSGHERGCADRVIAELASMGLAVDEDASGSETGSEAGNLLVRIPGRDPASLLICAHLDTVPPLAPIAPVLTDGYWENANAG